MLERVSNTCVPLAEYGTLCTYPGNTPYASLLRPPLRDPAIVSFSLPFPSDSPPSLPLSRVGANLSDFLGPKLSHRFYPAVTQGSPLEQPSHTSTTVFIHCDIIQPNTLLLSPLPSCPSCPSVLFYLVILTRSPKSRSRTGNQPPSARSFSTTPFHPLSIATPPPTHTDTHKHTRDTLFSLCCRQGNKSEHRKTWHT